MRKPGALRNGAPFNSRDVPPALRRVQRKLERQPCGDWRVMEIFGKVPTDGIETVEAAFAEALSHRTDSTSRSGTSWVAGQVHEVCCDIWM